MMLIVSGVIVFVLIIGLFLFFESGFGILFMMKLIELLSFNYLLLCKILIEIFGIYYYSVMVVNLFEVVCEMIGVNGLLVRVGVYYYDIGKMKWL